MLPRLHHHPLLALTLLVAALAGCGTGVRDNSITTSVAPLATDDLSQPCTYETPLFTQNAPQTAVLVIFERGSSVDLYQDPDLRALALTLHVTLVFAHQCNATSSGDFQSDASKGPARALFTALTQFASLTKHPELATSPVLLFGFSAAGALTLTLAETNPDRVLGVLAYAPGSAYLNLEDLPIPAATARVPTLIMANALDSVVGTTRSLDYFTRGRTLGAPWAFAVQNDTGHCCILSAKPLILPWIAALAAVPSSVATTATTANFSCQLNDTTDSYGDTDCGFISAALGSPTTTTNLHAADASPTPTPQQTVWLPDTPAAQAWLTWVTSPATNASTEPAAK